MKIVIAPDKFKEALPAREVAAAIERGVRRVLPDAQIDAVPMADGGDGTVDALLAATGGTRRRTTVTGPLGTPVEAVWGILGPVADPQRAVADRHGSVWDRHPAGPNDRLEAGPTSFGASTAVIEMAAASGLALVPPDRRDPTRTTTYGTGELIRAALDAGVSRILIGIGGSATVDGGVGAAQAVGVSFCDVQGLTAYHHVLTGKDLLSIGRIFLGTRDPRIAHTRIEVACDVDNPLVGPRGAAAVYGPQKGATPEQVEMLDITLSFLADVIKLELGEDVRDLPGAGAAGGLGAGLVAFFGATMRPGIEMVMEAARLSKRIRGADLIVTGEGRLDRQSMMGKVIAGVGRLGQSAGVPVIALVGSLGDGADDTLRVLRSYHCITPEGTPLAEALAHTAENLESAAVDLMRRFVSSHDG